MMMVASVPKQRGWESLLKKDGDELFDHYRYSLEELGNEKGLLGLISTKSQNKFQDPAKLRWRSYDYGDLVARDKASLDIFWLRDESLEDSDNLSAPGVIAAKIVEDLESALEQMRLIVEDLGQETDSAI